MRVGSSFWTANRPGRQVQEGWPNTQAGRQAASQHTRKPRSASSANMGAAPLTWNSSCALDISSSGVMMPSCASSVASMSGGSGGSAAGRGSGGGGG